MQEFCVFWWDWAPFRKQLCHPTLKHHQSKNFTLLQNAPCSGWLRTGYTTEPSWTHPGEPESPTHKPFSCLLTVLGLLKVSRDMRASENLAWAFSKIQFFSTGITNQARTMPTSHSTNQLLYTVEIFDVWSSLEMCLWREEKKVFSGFIISIPRKKERKKWVMSTPKSPSVYKMKHEMVFRDEIHLVKDFWWM